MLRRIVPIVMTVLLLTVTLFLKTDKATINVDSQSIVKQIIVLDAGHGGFDGGAQGIDGTLEKDLNYSIVCKIAEFLRLGGFDVMLTRKGDESLETNPDDTIGKRKVSDMKNRLQMINSYTDSVFVSIHQNKFSTSNVNGAQVFYSPNNDNSQILAEKIQSSLTRQLQTSNKRSIKRADKTIYLLNKAKNPAVLVECGFLSNKKELELLKTEEYQCKLAFTIYCGIIDYFG